MAHRSENPGSARIRRGSRATGRGRRSGGFTLIEMAVVVAILGVIASTAIPGYMRYVYKARRAEALVALQAIHAMQVVHHGRTGGYAGTFDELGFHLGGAELQADGSLVGEYYTYVLETRPLNGQPDGNFRATATGDIDPSDGVLDIIIIENQLTVKQ